MEKIILNVINDYIGSLGQFSTRGSMVIAVKEKCNYAHSKPYLMSFDIQEVVGTDECGLAAQNAGNLIPNL